MSLLRGASIKQKLTWIIVFTSAIALLVASTAFFANDVMAMRHDKVLDLSGLADVIGGNCTSALVFGDEKAAADTLGTLKARPNVVSAAIYTAEGTALARYQRSTAGAAEAPASVPPDGHRFTSDALVMTRPVTLEHEQVGTVYLRSDLADITQRLLQYAGLALVVILLASLVAYLVASRLQGLISEPVLSLAQTARTVSKNEDYSVRALKQTDDEIGYLIDRFNQMLAQIEARDHHLQDVNERLKQSEQAALEANQTKSDFLAKMSHELRTPLNAIIGYSEMLQEEAEDTGQEHWVPDLEKIHSAGKHLLALINDILDLSKIEAGRMALYLEPFEVKPLVSEAASTIAPLIEKNGNTLEVDCSPDVGVMRADVTKVRQALLNLLSNATKFTERGTIRLRIRRDAAADGDWLSFEVADTGIGMSAEQLERLFREFSQADASITRKYGGTGLGLVITQRFCRMMGGDATVTSRLGAGSVFTIRLPAVVTDPTLPPAEAPETTLPTEVAGALPVLLVIDDDPTVHDLIRRFLAREPFQVESALGGEEGLRRARELRPAVITLDVMMPQVDGWSVLSALKSDPLLADIPVIMVTIVDNRGLGFALGAVEYLTKPIDRTRLALVLERFRRPPPPQTVLVVDDDQHARELLRRHLEKEGWFVREAANGKQALERAAASTPDLVLLDLMMPEMDGFQFVREFRTSQEGRSVPIIVLTSKDLTEKDRHLLNGQVKKVLRKGAYLREDLLTEIRALLAAHGQPAGVLDGGEQPPKPPRP